MNATGAEGGRDERHDLAELLPPSGEFALPPGRQAHHREQLMRQIDDETRAADGRTTGAAPAREGARASWLRPAVLLPAAALALAGAVATGITVSGATGGDGVRTAETQEERVPAAATTVTQILDRASAAAAARKPVEVTDDSWVYVRSKVREGELGSGRIELGALEEREVWHTQQPGPVERLGYLATGGGRALPINLGLGDRPEDAVPGITRPTYAWLAALPTDPAALLDLLYEQTPQDDGQERDQLVFEQVRELVAETVLPPENAAALYRAAARIPGVVAAPDAVDALGRDGLGIAREDRKHGVRSEWVFDRDTLAHLGSRTLLTRDLPYGRKGELLSSHAVLGWGVSEKGGERPADSSSWQPRGGTPRTAGS